MCPPPPGDGADAALQPASDRGAEEQADSGEDQTAEDPAQRRQDPHGHVQEEPSHHRGCDQPRAGEGEGQTGEVVFWGEGGLYRATNVTYRLCFPVCSSGGEETEEREAASASET